MGTSDNILIWTFYIKFTEVIEIRFIAKILNKNTCKNDLETQWENSIRQCRLMIELIINHVLFIIMLFFTACAWKHPDKSSHFPGFVYNIQFGYNPWFFSNIMKLYSMLDTVGFSLYPWLWIVQSVKSYQWSSNPNEAIDKVRSALV